MKKPIIGVTPLVDVEKESLWMLPGYMDGVTLCGGLPIMLPLTADEETICQLADFCNGFLFTGGQDVSPALYKEETLKTCAQRSPIRDAMETVLLREALRLDKPVLGICRGIQFINAALGGTLYQDLPTQKPSEVEHHQSPPYDIPVHEVTLCAGSPLHRLLQKETLSVNSYHHQAVKTLAPSLKAMAVSTDGLVEAVYLPQKHFVWAVQWHPEFAYQADEDCRKIFAEFIKATTSKY